MKKQIEKAAQGEQWKLDVVDTARGREYRGILGSDDEEAGSEPDKEAKSNEEPKRDKKTKTNEDPKRDKRATGNEDPKPKDKGQKKQQKPKQKDKKQQEGSEEEYYKEEL